MDEAPDGEVAAAFSKGQPGALALVCTIALRSLDARAGAEDVTQQVFAARWAAG